jgi:hypothetical protein
MAFVHVDAKGHKAPHNIKIIAETDEEKRLQSMVPKHS